MKCASDAEEYCERRDAYGCEGCPLLLAPAVPSPLDRLVMPEFVKRDGFKIKYVGRGDNTYRHYPHSFITAPGGNLRRIRRDGRRTDTVKAIPNCLHVWEYYPI